MISFEGNGRYVGEAFEGERVGLQRHGAAWHVYFGPLLLGQLDAHALTGIQATWFRKRKRRG